MPAMRSRLVLGALLAVLGLPLPSGAAPPAASPQGEDLAAAPRISQQAFKQALATHSIVVIDVRDPVSYSNGHIPGAVSIPLDDLSKHLTQLKAEKRPIVTYCS